MTSKKLQEIALRHIAEKGYEGTALADIAGEIGIKKPSIYAHYASKMDLFMAIVKEAKDDYRACWRQALSQTAQLPADRRLEAVFEMVSSHFVGDRVKMGFWIRLWIFPPAECSAAILDSLKEMNREFLQAVAAIFRQGMEEGVLRQGPAEEWAQAFFSIIVGYLMRAICYQDMNYAESRRQLWNCFAQGVKAAPAGWQQAQ